MAKNARSLIMVTCSNRQGGNSVPYIMTPHQWLGSKRWLLFRYKVVICQDISKFVLGALYVCKRSQTNCQCMNSSVGTRFLSLYRSGENHHHGVQNPPYSAERRVDGLCRRHFTVLPPLVLELVLGLAPVTVLDDPEEFREAANRQRLLQQS